MRKWKLNLDPWNIEAYLEFINSKLSSRGFWVSWLIVLGTVCLIHLLTFKISPPLWVDEAQIIEHGRLIPFEPHSEWSMNWSSAANRPILLWSYLGPALQETAFRITTPLPFGPRIASLLGAMIAATASVGWLLAMKTYRPIALILGLVFLLDYIFVQSYRGARVDCWVLALCFGACWVVRYAMSRMREERPFRWLLTMGGSMAAIAFFVWPSAVLTYPLVLAELLVLLREEYSIRKSGASILRSVMAFVTSGLVTTSLLLIPIWHLLKTVFNDIEPVLRASQPPYSLSLQIKNLLDSFKFSQLLPVSALIGFIWGRGRIMAWMALLVFVYILSTLLYLNRLIYLLPYAIGLIGGVYQIPSTLMANAKTRRLITHVGLSLVIVGSVSLSLIIRPAIALSQRGERDPSILFSLGRESIGNGPYRVYLGAWEFYFVGRWFGWQMLNEYVDRDQRNVSRLLSRADHAIFRLGDVDYNLAAQLSTAGLYLQKELTDDRQHQMDMKQQVRLGARAYGPYVLYSRQIASEGQ
jgi:hypothetical protein